MDDVFQGISIHAPREGGDPALHYQVVFYQKDFNPRPPRGGRRRAAARRSMICNISIHAPREGGDQTRRPQDLVDGISIHAPREGGDCTISPSSQVISSFQSTPPARGATKIQHSCLPAVLISIHAPREGGDGAGGNGRSSGSDFNPRPPRGGRRRRGAGLPLRRRFQSTPPARGATNRSRCSCYPPDISIHAPREGGDGRRRRVPRRGEDFNPRPPRGGRRRCGAGSWP